MEGKCYALTLLLSTYKMDTKSGTCDVEVTDLLVFDFNDILIFSALNYP